MSRFVSCIVICEISYEISCLMHNHIFIWRENSRDLVRNIVWDFARFRMRYRLEFCEISYELSRVEYNGRGFVTNESNNESKPRSNNRCLIGPESAEYNSLKFN